MGLQHRIKNNIKDSIALITGASTIIFGLIVFYMIFPWVIKHILVYWVIVIALTMLFSGFTLHYKHRFKGVRYSPDVNAFDSVFANFLVVIGITLLISVSLYKAIDLQDSGTFASWSGFVLAIVLALTTLHSFHSDSKSHAAAGTTYNDFMEFTEALTRDIRNELSQTTPLLRMLVNNPHFGGVTAPVEDQTITKEIVDDVRHRPVHQASDITKNFYYAIVDLIMKMTSADGKVQIIYAGQQRLDEYHKNFVPETLVDNRDETNRLVGIWSKSLDDFIKKLQLVNEASHFKPLLIQRSDFIPAQQYIIVGSRVYHFVIDSDNTIREKAKAKVDSCRIVYDKQQVYFFNKDFAAWQAWLISTKKTENVNNSTDEEEKDGERSPTSAAHTS